MAVEMAVKEQSKNELSAKQLAFAQLTGMRRTAAKTGEYMLNYNTLHKFSDYSFTGLSDAMDTITKVTDPSSLSQVENHLQEQINSIREDIKENPKNIKVISMCLFTLQSMILNLPNIQLPNGVENTYVPKLLRKKMELTKLASEKGASWEKIQDHIHVSHYTKELDPSCSHWQFLDAPAMDKYINDLKLEQKKDLKTPYYTEVFDSDRTHSYDKRFEAMNSDFYQETNADWKSISHGSLDTFEKSEQEINQVLSDVIKDFGDIELLNTAHDFEKIYNLGKQKLFPNNQNNDAKNPYPVNYPTMNLFADSVMKRLADSQYMKVVDRHIEDITAGKQI